MDKNKIKIISIILMISLFTTIFTGCNGETDETESYISYTDDSSSEVDETDEEFRLPDTRKRDEYAVMFEDRNEIVIPEIPDRTNDDKTENLVNHGDFGGGWTGPDEISDDADLFDWLSIVPDGTDTRFELIEGGGPDGKNCIEYTKGTQESVNLHLHQAIRVEPETQYIVSAYVKSDGNLSPLLAAQNFTWGLIAIEDCGSSTEWKEVSFEFNSGENDKIRLSWFAGAKGEPYEGFAGTSRIANVSVRKVMDTTQYNHISIFGNEISSAIGNGVFGVQFHYQKEQSHVRRNEQFRESMFYLNPGMLRFPGGEDSNNYLWETRTVYRSDWFYGTAIPLLDLNTDEFLEYCKERDIEPIFVINYATGKYRDDMEWVYSNAEKWLQHTLDQGYKVRYWEFGNEPYFPELDFRRLRVEPEEYAKEYLEMRRRLKAIDPDVKLGACVPHYWDHNEVWQIDDWAPRFFKTVEDEVDFIVPHMYLSGSRAAAFERNGFPTEDWVNSYRINAYEKYGIEDLEIIPSEWNLLSRNHSIAPDGVGKGLVVADGVLGFIKSGVENAIVWPLRWRTWAGLEKWGETESGLLREDNHEMMPAGEIFAWLNYEIEGMKEMEVQIHRKDSPVSILALADKEQGIAKAVVINRSVTSSGKFVAKFEGLSAAKTGGRSYVPKPHEEGKVTRYDEKTQGVFIDLETSTDGENTVFEVPPFSVSIVTWIMDE